MACTCCASCWIMAMGAAIAFATASFTSVTFIVAAAELGVEGWRDEAAGTDGDVEVRDPEQRCDASDCPEEAAAAWSLRRCLGSGGA